MCGGKSHCKQSYFVKLSRAKASLWWPYPPPGSVCNLKEKKKKAAILHGHLNTTKVKHLSTCKHWKTKLAERKEKKKNEKEKERKRNQNIANRDLPPRSCDLAFFLQNGSLRGNWIQLARGTHFAYWTNTKWTEIITYLWGFTEFKLDSKYKNKLGLCSFVSLSAWKYFSETGLCQLGNTKCGLPEPRFFFFSELPRFLIWGPFVWFLNGFREQSVLVWLWV